MWKDWLFSRVMKCGKTTFNTNHFLFFYTISKIKPQGMANECAFEWTCNTCNTSEDIGAELKYDMIHTVYQHFCNV